jgi:penicillin amidase
MELINIWKRVAHRVSVGRCRKKNSPLKMFIIFWIHVFSFAMAHKTDPLLTDIQYGMEYLKDFGLDGELNTTLIKTRRRRVLAISKSVTALLDNSRFLLL